MNARVWICAVALPVFIIAAAQAHEKAAPPVWKQIEDEARAIVQEGEKHDYGELRERQDKLAFEIAKRAGRAEISQMVRDVNEHLRKERLERQALLIQMQARAISIRVLLHVADPKGEFVYGWGHRDADSVNWFGAAAAAIDTYHDNQSRDLLLELALKRESRQVWAYQRGGDMAFASPVGYNLGLLRSYSPEGIRPRIEAALQEDAKKELPKVPRNATPIMRLDYLRALLESWRYAAALAPAERDRYRDFEHRLWRGWALAGGWGDHVIAVPFGVGAYLLRKQWKDGDEQFVLRIFEEPTSTIEETHIAEHLAYRLSAEGIRQLEKLAASDSSRARFATAALKEAAEARSREAAKGPEH